MLNTRNLLLTLGLTGAAVVAVLNVCANRLSTREARLQRKALHRWEGEGGNVITPAMPVRDELSQDATP
ncbi:MULTISPECIES: hypothetical protein [unclassified Herbaspirillum]|jgi:hypothetical protein|uniref:hypothetical protein n=1 Tax=unclassified Herbaspirillum TaxID=2624150 RepID=UPI0010726947|nr:MULTISPECIES: hypothetical protein [unclassified Herbaspirillum]TFI09980.1 hypothetical protein E4P32_00030 [Herbaspirillum sp. 3R11]TFI15884.1 hypothetical protein E4P31_00030 [Herbaspirillum sp. 3R-11]TFI19849.1 hypothetical protein E4P30_23590 [Herbaspirillum sp. 3C11]